MPDELKAALATDGLVLLEEGLSGSVTYRKYRAPGQYFSWRKQGISAAIGISAHRVIVWDGRMKQVDGPPAQLIGLGVTFTVVEQDLVSISYDAGQFSTERSGSVEVRLRTPQARRIVTLLTGAQ
jgi:hypothetical protein